MKILKTIFVCTSTFFVATAYPAEWKLASPNTKIYLDVDSLRAYPGMVVGDMRRDHAQDFVTFFRVGYMCGGRYFISVGGPDTRNAGEAAARDIPLYLGNAEPIHPEYEAEILKFFKNYCGHPSSAVQLEIPVGQTKNLQSVFLAKETRFDGNNVSAWLKYYKTKNEKIMHKGKQVKIEGKPLEHEIIDKNANVTLDKIEVDCRNSKLKYITSAVYKPDGTLVSTQKINETTDTIPGSLGRQEADVLCALRPSR